MRYFNGEVELSVTELSSRGFGQAWGHTRTYSNQLSASFDFGNGFNWIVKQWAYLTEGTGGEIVFVRSPRDAVWFDPSGGDYVARYGAMQTLTHDAGNETFTVASPDGDRWVFHDFTQTTFPQGLLKSYVSVGNQAIEVTSYTIDNRIGQIERGSVVDGVALAEAFAYEYLTGALAGCLATVTLRRRTGAAPWSDVRRVRYDYYSVNEDFGGEGDLRSAVVEAPLGLTWGAVTTRYYRYYRDGDVNGFAHGLKFVFDSAAFHRLQRSTGNAFTATDAEAASFADFYYEYDSDQRVVLERVAAGSREFTFSYTDSGNSDAPNHWTRKTVETQPDGTQNIIYSNFLGQVLLKDFKAGSDHWITAREYGEASDAASKFRLVQRAEPSAVVSYDDTQADLGVVLRTGAGLIYVNRYYDGTGGSTLGFPAGNSLQQGSSGTPIKLKDWQWSSSTVGGLTVYNLSQEVVYKSDVGGGSDPIVTSYTYAYRSGTNQIEQQTTTLPAVSTSQNGSGTSPEQRELYDEFGNMIWEQGPKGFIDNFRYDIATAARTQMIDDVDSAVLPYPSGWTRPSNLPPPLHLVTDYTNDALGRNEEMLGPVHEIDGVAVRQASWTLRLDIEHETRRARGFATSVGPNYVFTLVNPVSISRRNETADVRDRVSAVRDVTEGRPTAADEFPQASWVAWSQSCFNLQDELIASRTYHTIPAAGNGTSRTNFDETTYAYDLMGRRNRVRSPGGTITRTTFDSRGLPIGTWVGTNDTWATDSDPSGGGASGNNMVVVTANQYDGGSAGGDGNLTRLTHFVDADSANDRVTLFEYDFRNRRTTIDGEVDFYQVTTFDNLDRAVKIQRYDSVAPPTGTLILQSETLYDDRGNVYQAKRYAVNPSTGVVGNVLVDNFWYDAAGNGIKELPAGSERFTKSSFDGVGRETARYDGYYTGSGVEPYADVGLVTTENKIFEQLLTSYDGASNRLQLIAYQRFHDATGNGVLNLPDGSQPKARVTYVANYFDGVGRLLDAADFGTNGNVAFARPTHVPVRSDDVLVTSTGYDAAGLAFQTIDPAGIETRRAYDAQGREIAFIQNYTVNAASCGEANITTRFTYTPDGKPSTLTAVNPATGDQETKYLYGTTLTDSSLARSDLLAAVIYPDASDVADRVSYRYNRQSEVTRQQDQNSTVHELVYDKLGRRTIDRVTHLGTDVEGAVRRIETGFDVRGFVETVTNYDAAISGSVVNQVRRTYNDFGLIAIEYQEHGGAVNTSTSLNVRYSYADGSANTVRATSMTYPNGRVVSRNYGTSGGDDDQLSRVTSLDDAGSAERVSYKYLGLGAFVRSDYPEPQVRWDLITGTGVNPYAGLDRFGRVINCLWRNYGASIDAERVEYGYDRASNRIWRENTVAPSGENDELYGYDRLQRLVRSARGTLSVDKSYVDDLQFAQDWTLDATGNWNRLLQTDSNDPTENLDQARKQNAANEITAIIRRYGADWPSPEYDRAGNMTLFPQPATPTSSYSATYDAWNRLVALSGGNSYAYDPFNRRTMQVAGGVTRHYYYSTQWQVLEERLGTSPDTADAERQFVWGLRYIDDLVLRDRSPTNNGTLSERLYSLSDANWNATAVVDAAGDVQERYRYSAYGTPTFLQPDFTPRLPNQSDFNWETLYAGYRRDEASELSQVRNRYLNSTVGQWITRDPVEYEGGLNLYEYGFDDPIARVDPYGTQVWEKALPLAGGAAAIDGPIPIGDVIAIVIIVGAGIYDNCSTCDCLCLGKNHKGNNTGPYPVGKMSPAACRSYPYKAGFARGYHTCFCR